MSSVIRRRRQGDAGAVAINLVLVLGFALYAVVQLSRTTLAAQQIDDRVVSITSSVGPIDETLDNVPKLDETNVTAAGILVAADGLTGQLDQVIAAAGSINNTVQPINQSVLSIGSTVQSINGTVGSIAGTVNSIEGNASGILSTVNEIQPGIVTINQKADLVIEDARQILGDLDNTLVQVSGNSQIAFHANSIDNATCLLAILNLDVAGLLTCVG